jgi:hypothetical protein
MTKPALQQKSRSYSKKIVAWALAGIYLLALLGRDAEVIYAVGTISISLILIYIANGQLDLRALLKTGIIDLRKKGS